MRLSFRVTLLRLVCLIPVVAVGVSAVRQLEAAHGTELSGFLMRQAELANGDLEGIIFATRQLGAAVAQFPDLHESPAACQNRLAALGRTLPAYRFLAVVGEAGTIRCASTPAIAAEGPKPPWLAGLGAAPDGAIGRYSQLEGVAGVGFLPIATPLPGGELLVTALDLRWLTQHLVDARRSPIARPSRPGVIIADREGTVLARAPEGDQWTGQRLPAPLRGMSNDERSDVTLVAGPDGSQLAVAFVPASIPPLGLTAIATLPAADLAAADADVLWNGAMLLAILVVVLLLIALVYGDRLLDRPLTHLSTLASRWSGGETAPRADPAKMPGPFRPLAAALNATVMRLTRDDADQRRRLDRISAELNERRRDLSHANNRLQVEIAERDKSEVALHHGQKLQAIGQLSGGIAHDFNNLLATILGSLELMERRVAQGTADPANADRLRTLIERAIGAVQRGAQLTSGLLAFSRRQPMPARPTDLNALITDLATLATSTLGRRIRLTTELDPNLWPAMVDPSQIEAAILNLCLNARDAMPEGGTLTIRTTNLAIGGPAAAPDLAPGAYVSIAVGDTGIGMTAPVQRRAFDPFFTTKGDAGSGLGLSQVQAAARQAGGAVRLESTPGTGTTITLLLPRGTDQADPQKPVAAPVDRSAPAARVLVVDDDPAVRQVTVEMLHDLGCDVVEAPGGSEALAQLAGFEPDIILVDYAMPGMNGLQLTRILRDRGITRPIAMVTGYAELDDTEAGQSPLDGLLRKPFTIQELQALLSTLRSKGERGSNVVRLNLAR